jgi:hypothetical protein
MRRTQGNYVLAKDHLQVSRRHPGKRWVNFMLRGKYLVWVDDQRWQLSQAEAPAGKRLP